MLPIKILPKKLKFTGSIFAKIYNNKLVKTAANVVQFAGTEVT
jgi:hypothetical protein